jgi:hypothetical protein
MKKQLTLIALAFTVSTTFAQDLTSKKGEQILPEAEDWSIGADATPFLQYMGNFFGKTTTNNAPTFNFLNPSSPLFITGKYFVEAQKAYRAGVRIGLGTVTNREMVADRSARSMAQATPTAPSTYPAGAAQKENVWKRSTTNIGLSVGIEKRKGKTRLQGYYGGEAGIAFSSSKDKFTYGNSLNPNGAAITPSSNPRVVVTGEDSFSGASNVTASTFSSIPGMVGDARVTERKNGSSFTFGVRGFIGVEYFVLPKISLGGEFGWGLGLTTFGKTKTTYESEGDDNVALTDNTTGTTTIEGSKDGQFILDINNANSMFGPSGSLRLNFHF